MEYKLKIPAKINLSLDITGKRDDGYHLLSTVMQTIDIYDYVTISEKPSSGEKSTIKIISPGLRIDEKETTMYRALKVFLDHAPVDCFLHNRDINIYVEKNIPVQAGLAGGSCDASGVLTGLNCLSEMLFTGHDIEKMGALVGADVPFCLRGGTVLCEGIGEKMTNLCPFPETDILIVKPPFGVSTPWIFRNYTAEKILRRPDTKIITESINQGNREKVYKHTANVLEEVTALKFPEINKTKEILYKKGAEFAMMTGSGSSVFGVFSSRDKALHAKTEIEGEGILPGSLLIVSRTLKNGPLIV